MQNTKRSVKLAAATTAVLAGLLTFNSSAMAQQRVGSDGHARDSSNLVGSNGYNGSGGGNSLYSNLVNNSIVSGDITGGKAFRGNLSFEDPTAFHGNLPGTNISNFVAQSSGATTSGVLTDNANQTRIYLGDNRGVNAPSNFVAVGNNGGYIQSPNVAGSSFSDGRLGDPAAVPTGSIDPQSLFLPAGTQAGGGRSSYLTASPLYGVQKLDNAQQNTGSSSFGNQANSSALNNSALGASLDDSAQTRLQALNEGFNSDLTPGSSVNSSNPQSPSGGVGQTGIGTQQGLPTNTANLPLNNSANQNQTNSDGSANSQTDNQTGNNSLLQNPLNVQNSSNGSGSLNGANGTAQIQGGAALNNRPLDRPLNAQIASGDALNSGDQRLGASIHTGQDSQSSVANIKAASANQQSAYFRMLGQLQARAGSGALTSQQQRMLKDFNSQNQIKPEISDPSRTGELAGRNQSSFGTSNIPSNSGTGAMSGALSGTGVGGANGRTGSPLLGGNTGGAISPQQIATPKSSPTSIVIPSFAHEETDKTLVPVLSKAEDLMKQGKFSSAVDQYDQAEQIAPNDPFVWLGRANAELGTTSYGLAEQHLRRAFLSDQALMMARYDLSALIGNERLQYLIKDLKDIATANPNESRPVFLLAYICYNTNKDRAAANYLNLAAKREGKADPLFKLLQERWDLPDVTGDDSELSK